MAKKDAGATKVPFKKVVLAGSVLVFKLGNGTEYRFDCDAAPAKQKRLAMIHGFNQKIGDGTSGFSKTTDYVGALAEMQAIGASIMADEWLRKGGATGPNLDHLARALAEYRSVSVAVTTPAVEKATEEQRAAWAKNGKIAALILRYRSEEADARAQGATDEELPTFPEAGEESDES